MRHVADPTANEIRAWTDEERAEYEEALRAPESYRALAVAQVVTKNRAAHAQEHWPDDEVAKEIRSQLGDGSEMARILRELLTTQEDPEERHEIEILLQRLRENGIPVDDA
jgi:hypothetical protein